MVHDAPGTIAKAEVTIEKAEAIECRTYLVYVHVAVQTTTRKETAWCRCGGRVVHEAEIRATKSYRCDLVCRRSEMGYIHLQVFVWPVVRLSSCAFGR